MNTEAMLRDLCTNCRTSPTSKNVCGTPFEARQLDRTQSVVARRGILESSQVISNQLAVILPNALDGREWSWEEILPAMVQSRATGGLSKFECGFDPSTFKRKKHKKVQKTERMYIHHEECMLNYIGSTLQDNTVTTAPVYIRNSDSLIDIGMNQSFVIDLMMNDMRSMSRAIDGNVVLGNWAGDNSSTTSITPQMAGGVQTFPHFDGAIKMALLQGDEMYYPSVDVTVPAIVGAAAYFLKWGGTWMGAFTTPALLVDALNELKIDITGTKPYTAVLTAATTVRITGSDPEGEVYGFEALQIMHSEDGTVNACSEALGYTTVQNAMPYAEKPILFDFQEINALNFYDYFKDVIRTIRREMVTLHESGQAPAAVLQRQYIAIDPLLYLEKDFSRLMELCSCENAGDKLGLLDQMFPRFVPLKVLEGTGLWYWTTQDNLIILTNGTDSSLPNIEIWHDKDCDKVKGRNEMLLNCLVADFAIFATNAKNSPFHKCLTDAYQPENLPHLSSDCAQATVCGSASSNTAIASACFELDDVSGDYTLILEDESSLSNGVTVTAYEWTVFVAGAAANPGTQAESVSFPVAAADFPNLNLVVSKLTLSDGSVIETTIPASAIQECC